MKKFFSVVDKDKAHSSSAIDKDYKVFDFEILESDPAKRHPITRYHPNIRDQIRKAYLKKGPHQPVNFDFKWTDYGRQRRRFGKHWFVSYDWLEFSESTNKAYCLPCFLFKDVTKYGGDHFVSDGFDDWNNPQRLSTHVTSAHSSHNDCVKMGYDLMNPKQSIKAAFVKHDKKINADYRVRVSTSLRAAKYLLRCGLAFRGNDESDDSSYKGPFLELLNTLKEGNQEIANVLECAPKNNLMTSPKIQKDLAAACASEITLQIVCDIRDDVFCVLIDESGDCSGKEQMAIVVHYVDSEGLVKERFLGIVNVKETTAISLKEALEQLLSVNGLSVSSIRGQGYDGASNMRGRFGGLRALIQKENPFAYYVHCFAHQLQLALVACSKIHKDVFDFFSKVNMIVNFIRSSNKRQELLRGKQSTHFASLIEEGEIETGRGLNQESSIARAGDTRWGSHFRTLTSLMTLYGAVIGVLEEVEKDPSGEKSGEALYLLDVLQSFDFIFLLHLMVEILGITNGLNVALQRRDQDLLNALSLVNDCKDELQELRDDGWEQLLSKVVKICNRLDIDVPDMDATYMQRKKARNLEPSVSNLNYYKHDCLFRVVDLQLQELNSRFDEGSTELLQCVACLSPHSSFGAFDEDKLLRMVQLYPNDFVGVPEMVVRHQLRNYVRNVRADPNFAELKGLSDLCVKLVKTNKCTTFDVVYKLLKLALILPVATASVERVFSGMNYVKSQLRNKMGDQWLNDRLITFLERDVLRTISDDVIITHFQQMSDRRYTL